MFRFVKRLFRKKAVALPPAAIIPPAPSRPLHVPIPALEVSDCCVTMYGAIRRKSPNPHAYDIVKVSGGVPITEKGLVVTLDSIIRTWWVANHHAVEDFDAEGRTPDEAVIELVCHVIRRAQPASC